MTVSSDSEPESNGQLLFDWAGASTPQQRFGYCPGHPWHYYHEGDNAPPVPFDAIPTNIAAGESLREDMPRSPLKRLIKSRELLTSELSALEAARVRYQSVVYGSANALSRYDRDIAFSGNLEMARAGTFALLFHQISWHLGRIASLERAQSRHGGLGR